MSSIPENWGLANIGEVLLADNKGNCIQQGWSPKCEGFPAPAGSWGALKTTAIQAGRFLPDENKCLPEHLKPRPQLEVECDDIVLTCAGPRNRCGIACRIPPVRSKLMISGKMYRLRANREVIRPAYLENYLISSGVQTTIDRMKSGINDSGLNLTKSRFLTLQVPLPPIDEQRRIVAKIEELFSELDKGVDSLRIARTQLKSYRRSLLKAAFEGHLTEQWRKENANNVESADQLLQQIHEEREARHQQQLEEWEAAVTAWEENGGQLKKPRKPRANKPVSINPDDSLNSVDGWLWRSLSEVSGTIVDGTHKTPVYVDAGVPFISAKDIKDFRLNFTECRFITQEEHQALIKRCCPTESDVLVTKSGTIGRVAVVETKKQFSVFESVALVPVPKCMDSKFVAYACYFFINSGYAEKTQKGVAVRHLHLENLRRLPIPVPPIQEQERLVQIVEHHISASREATKDIERELGRAERLRQSILKRAFEGKLVPQDPNDEPASVLLERIQQEQRDTPKPKRHKRKVGATS